MANCTVMVTVGTGDAKITKYECDTQQGVYTLFILFVCLFYISCQHFYNYSVLQCLHMVTKIT